MGIAIAWFAAHDYTVLVPLTDSQSYDLAVDNGTLQRVFVRTTTRVNKNGTFAVGLRTQGGNKSQFSVRSFDKGSVDLLFVACSNGDQYLIPSSKVEAKSEITVGKKYTEYKV